MEFEYSWENFKIEYEIFKVELETSKQNMKLRSRIGCPSLWLLYKDCKFIFSMTLTYKLFYENYI